MEGALTALYPKLFLKTVVPILAPALPPVASQTNVKFWRRRRNPDGGNEVVFGAADFRGTFPKTGPSGDGPIDAVPVEGRASFDSSLSPEQSNVQIKRFDPLDSDCRSCGMAMVDDYVPVRAAGHRHDRRRDE